jgi:protein-tyrosine phosphatase
MRTNVFWVPGPWPGRLGILPRPRGGDWLTDETRAWHDAGIDVVVSLLEPEEEAQLMLDDEAAAAARVGVEFESFPIPDRGVPASRESVAALTRHIMEVLEAGRKVAVHCRQGIGRSALIVGGVLVAAGEHPATALKTIAQARGVEVPETEEQRQWLRDFAASLAPSTAAHAAADTRHPRVRARSKGHG